MATRELKIAEQDQSAAASRRTLVLPGATVFVASFCIMVLELVASRLIARHLGSSLYTWTSVIGVVLAGITLGNLAGGRIADRYPARRALGVLFLIAAAACVLTVVLNPLVGEWAWLWTLSWPSRVFTHVVLVFILPSTLLGTISPVVAKMALDEGLPTGHTVGNVYAWGAAGSIAGTFATGYFLISALGSMAVIWSVAGVLLVLGLGFSSGDWLSRFALVVFALAATLGWAPWPWARAAGAAISLRHDAEPNVVYERDTPYCYVAVKRTAADPETLSFYQDKLVHSRMIVGRLTDLQYDYERIHAAVTLRYRRDKQRLSTLFIGGGGYVLPRYLLEIAPGSRVDVVEIDPGVTAAAMAAFGLPRDTPINTYTLDARNYIDGLIRRQRRGEDGPRYDFIYEDAFNDYSVPYQLTTRELNDKIAEILADDGLYLVNLIDILDSGRFLGTYLHTLEQSFPHVEVIQQEGPAAMRKTFMVVASRVELRLQDLNLELPARDLDLALLTEEEKETLRRRAGPRVLTDDWAPVDNLMAPVARRSARDLHGQRVERAARELFDQGLYDQSIRKYRELLEVNPVSWAVTAHNQIAYMLAEQGKLDESVRRYREALAYNQRADYQEDVKHVHLSLGVALARTGRDQEARQHLSIALEGYRLEVQRKPRSLVALERLGDTYAALGRWDEAGRTFARALPFEPTKMENHLKVSQALEMLGRVGESIAVIDQAIAVMSRYGLAAEVDQLRQYRRMVVGRHSQ